MTDKTELEAQVAALAAEVAELKRRANLPAPTSNVRGGDWAQQAATARLIDRVAMPASVMREMAEAVPDAAVADIVRDGRAPQTLAPLEANTRPRAVVTGWEAPLEPPRGISLIDRQLDVQDQRDRAERIMQHARMKSVEKKEG
jgi:hypothetical protein